MLSLAWVVDVWVVTLCRIGIACEYVRETIHPCNHLGLESLTNSPLNPLLGIGLGNSHRNQSVTAMRFEGVAYAIGRQITRQEYYGIARQRYITESWVCLLKHRVKHVLHWVSTLRELIEHDDQRFLLVDTETCVGVIPCGLGIVVDHRHCDVTQVHIGYVNIGILKA